MRFPCKERLKNRTTQATFESIYLIFSGNAVVLSPKMGLLWHYSDTTAKKLFSILATAVKPFGYSRKTFRA